MPTYTFFRKGTNGEMTPAGSDQVADDVVDALSGMNPAAPSEWVALADDGTFTRLRVTQTTETQIAIVGGAGAGARG